MDNEIQKWFTEHGKVLSAEPIEDKASPVPGSTVIRYTFEDGAVLTLRPAKYDNGQQVAPQEIVGRELPKPKESPSTAMTPAQQRTAREEAEIAANAALPGPNPQGATEEERRGQDPRPETNAERAERAERVIKEQQVAAEKQAKENAPTRNIVEGADGKRYVIETSVDPTTKRTIVTTYDTAGNVVPGGVPGKPQGTTAEEVKPLEGKPGWQVRSRTVVDANGNKRAETVYIDPQGQETANPPAEALKPVLVNGQWGVWKPGPDGKPTFEPVNAPSEAKAHPGMPEFDASSPQAAHASYLAQARWAMNERREGRMTAKEAADLVTPSYTIANSMIEEDQRGITNALNSRRLDQQTEATRLSASTAQFPNAFNLVDYALRWGPQGGNEAAGLLAANVGLQTAMNQRLTGNVSPAVGAGAAPGPSASPAPLPRPGAATVPGAPPSAPPLPAVAGLAPPPPPMPATNTMDAGGTPRAMSPNINTLIGSPESVASPIAAPGVTPTTPTTPTGAGLPPIGEDPELEAFNRLPPAVQSMYGRSLLDQIVSRYG